MKKVTVLGSTGSIGKQTLELIAAMPEQFQVVALTAEKNVELLASQAKSMKAKAAVIGDTTLYPQLQSLLAGTDIMALSGSDAIVEAARMPADITIAAIVGIAGLASTMAAITQGKLVALACKEALVCAGSIMLREVRRYQTTLLPIDSEHNAIYQVFHPEERNAVSHITLTASGGPFLHTPLDALPTMTKAQALRHPNWVMGEKITVDSATMVNKVLETVEARYLFDLNASQVEIVIHPESIVHGLVHYHDGSILAQLGNHDMRMPIQYVLTWPERQKAHYPVLDLSTLQQLRFMPADPLRYPVLTLVPYLLTEDQAASIIFNAANEVAVQAFLAGTIGYTDIAQMIMQMMEQMPLEHVDSLEEVMALDGAVRRKAGVYLEHLAYTSKVCSL